MGAKRELLFHTCDQSLVQKQSFLNKFVQDCRFERTYTDTQYQYYVFPHSPTLIFIILPGLSIWNFALSNKPCGRCSGLVVSALDSGLSDPGSGPGRGHCVVFLGKTLYSHGASLHPRCINVYRRI